MLKRRMMKLTALTMAILLAVTLAPIGHLAVHANDTGTLELKNEIIKVTVNKKDGRFSVRTTGGSPARPDDDDKEVTYDRGEPETSFTSFLIDNEEVIYGHRYGPQLNLTGYFLQNPVLDGDRIVSVWTYKGVEIIQTIELMPQNDLKLYGNVLVNYTVLNKSGRTVKFGSRILLDTAVGGNDGALIQRTGDFDPVIGERMLRSDQVPLYWHALDNLEEPKMAAYGMLYGWGETKPSKVIFGHWSGLSSTKWNYEWNPWLDYTDPSNTYGTEDSAVAVYWEDMTLVDGGEASFSTIVGMGQESDQAAHQGFKINLNAPKRIVQEGNEPVTFELTAEIDNTYEGAEDLYDVEIQAAIPNQLQVMGGTGSYYVNKIGKNEKPVFKWTLRANQLEAVSVFNLRVAVIVSNGTPVYGDFPVVVLPSFQQPPEIQFNTISPTKMYIGEKFRKVVIRGSNLNYLKDDTSNWRLYLQDHRGDEYEVHDVTVENNYEISAFLPEDLPFGNYGIGIEHELTTGFFRPNVFEISDDVSLMKRGYGTLVITKTEEYKAVEGTNQALKTVTNHLHHFKGNTPVSLPAGHQEVMRLTGNILPLDDGNYSVMVDRQNQVRIGNLLTLTSASYQPGELVVKKRYFDYRDKDNVIVATTQQAEIQGDEKIWIYLSKTGQNLDHGAPLLWKNNKFEFNVNDIQFKNPNVWDLDEDFYAVISKFNIGIQKMRLYYDDLKKQYALEFSGVLDILNPLKEIFKLFGTKDNKAARFLFFADVQLDRFVVYEDGKVDVKVEAAVGLPQLRIGPFETEDSGSKDASGKQIASVEGRLKIDTIEDLYSVSTKVALPGITKSLQSGGNMLDKKDTAKIETTIGLFSVDTPIGVPLLFPDTVTAHYYDSFGFIQIPKTPFAINQLGGGIYDLHKIRDYISRNGEWPDTHGKFWFGIIDTVSPLFRGERLFKLQDATISLGAQKASFSGRAYIYGVSLLHAGLDLLFYPLTGAAAYGEINLLDVIIGRARADLNYNHLTGKFYAGGFVRGIVQIPDSIPVLSGMKLADVAAALNTDFVQAYVRVLKKVDLGITYTWETGQISFGDKSTAYALKTETADGTLVAVIGSNLYAVLTNDKSFTTDGSDALLIQVRYDPSQKPNVELTDPNNQLYALHFDGEDQNVLVSTYEDPDTGESMGLMVIAVPVEDNLPGTWKISSDISAKFEVYGAIPAMEISLLDIVKTGDLDYVAELTLNEDNGMNISRVDLYLEKADAEEDSPVLLVENAEWDPLDGKIAFRLPDGIQNGQYRIVAGLRQYANADDLANGVLTHYTRKESAAFNVVNPNLPPKAMNVSAAAIGDGMVRIAWDRVNDPKVTGYYVTAYDDEGNEAGGLDIVPQSDGTNRYEIDVRGWETGKHYTVTVQTVSGKLVSSDAGYDLIPAGNPQLAELDASGRYLVTWNALDGIEEYEITLKDGDGNTVITVPYYADPDEAADTLEMTLNHLTPDPDYLVVVHGRKYRDLTAKNVTVTDEGDGSVKKISWDRVPGNDIHSYWIIGKDQTGEATFVQLYSAGGAYPARYEQISIAGFEPNVQYDIAVIGIESSEEEDPLILGVPSDPITFELPKPNPPQFMISAFPTNLAGDGVVTSRADEMDRPYFVTNVIDVTLAYTSTDTVRTEISINPSIFTDNEDNVYTHEGTDWTQAVELREGINEIHLTAYNAQGDSHQETVIFAVKNRLPTLLMNDTVIENGMVVVSGISDADAEVYVNNQKAEVTADTGEFMAAFEAPDEALIPIRVRALDPVGNETSYQEELLNDQVNEIVRVQIEIDGKMPRGGILPLKLAAYDADGNRMIVPNEFVEWSIYEGAEHAQLINDQVHSLTEGKAVIAASYSVNEMFSWQDFMVLEIGPELAMPEEAYLFGLEASIGNLSPAFHRDTLNYQLNVPYSVSAISLKPFADLSGAEIEVNGERVESSKRSQSIMLNVGSNQITVAVRAPGYLERIYTIDAYRMNNNGGGSAGGTPGSSGNPQPGAAAGEDLHESQVNPEQGALIAHEGAVVNIPPGAFDRPFKLSIGKTDAAAASIPLEGMTRISPIFEITKDIAGDFSRPVTITLPYDRSKVQGREDSIGVYWLDESSGKWILLERIQVNPASGTASGEVTHFTKFAVFYGGPVMPVIVKFSDIAGHWAEKLIVRWVKEGRIKGYEDGTFRPDRQISRAEFVTLLVSTLPAEGSKAEHAFKDISGHWAQQAIETAYASGWISGFSGNRFGPDERITREQMVSIVMRALKAIRSDQLNSRQDGLTAFKDEADLAEWSRSDVLSAARSGLVSGYPDGTFRPQAHSTRAEALAILDKVWPAE